MLVVLAMERLPCLRMLATNDLTGFTITGGATQVDLADVGVTGGNIAVTGDNIDLNGDSYVAQLPDPSL